MKYFEMTHYRVIHAKSATTFERKLNDAIAELNDHKMDVFYLSDPSGDTGALG